MLQYERRAAVERYHWWFVALRSAVVRALPCDTQHQAVLDAGCGTGVMLAELPPDWRRVGIDADEGALSLAARHGGLVLLQADVHALPFDDREFDAVLSLDVIYHEGVDDVAALREMRRILRPGGRLVLQVPAYEWLRSSHDVAARGARRYTARRVRERLVAAQFVPEHVGYRVTFLFPVAVVSRLLHRRGNHTDVAPVRPRLNNAFLAMMRVEAAVARRVRLPFGLSIFAVAERCD